MVVALAIVAAIGDVRHLDRPEKLASYLNPSVRQSGPGPAYHGRITKQGGGHARGMLVEAAWRQRERRVRCARSSCACELGAASTSRPSQQPKSSRWSSGIR